MVNLKVYLTEEEYRRVEAASKKKGMTTEAFFKWAVMEAHRQKQREKLLAAAASNGTDTSVTPNPTA